jgi:hypothetical protein
MQNQGEDEATKSYKQLYIGAFIGLFVALITMFAQYFVDKQSKQDQLYLDEKKDFVIACDEFLRQYSQWHDLMDYCVYADMLKISPLAAVKNDEEFAKTYRKWKQNLDFAYSKIFLLSSNEFGITTMTASVGLHNSMDSLLYGHYDFESRKSIQLRANNTFFKNWLQVAQEEIFRYNTGNRDEKSLTEFLNEQKQQGVDKKNNESRDSGMYKNLSKAYEFMKKQDSINRNRTRGRMPTEEEFNQTLKELNHPK